jgi:hypothetical protein
MVNNKISPISIKQNNHFSPQLIGHRKKTMIHEVGNPGSDLGQAQKYGKVKLIYGVSTLPLLIFGAKICHFYLICYNFYKKDF